MITAVNLAAYRIQIFEDEVLKSSITYSSITQIVPVIITSSTNTTAPYTVLSSQYYVRLKLRSGMVEDIPLGNVGLAGWTNDAAGYTQAKSDIYDAFS